MQRLKQTTITFNTSSSKLVEAKFQTPLELLEGLELAGDLHIADKTTIQIDNEEISFYGTFKWECQRTMIKELTITPAFGAARVGKLVLSFKGEDFDLLRSKTIGTDAALPAPLQKP